MSFHNPSPMALLLSCTKQGPTTVLKILHFKLNPHTRHITLVTKNVVHFFSLQHVSSPRDFCFFFFSTTEEKNCYRCALDATANQCRQDTVCVRRPDQDRLSDWLTAAAVLVHRDAPVMCCSRELMSFRVPMPLN